MRFLSRYRWPIVALLLLLSVALGFYCYQSSVSSPVIKNPEEIGIKVIREIQGADIKYDPSRAYGDYTLLSFQYSSFICLIDMKGNIAYRWSAPFTTLWPSPGHIHSFAKARTFVETAYAYPNGDLLVQYSGLGDTPYGYGIAKIDKNSKLLWTYDDNAHHDFHVREEDGHIFALTHAIIKSPLKKLEALHYPLLTDYAVELSPEGKELKRISIAEAFTDTPFMDLLSKQAGRGNRDWDLLHTNSIMSLDTPLAAQFPMFEKGDLLISIRNKSLLAVISAQTGKVTHAYEGPWLEQHAASFTPQGTILLLDNQGQEGSKSSWARMLEIAPDTAKILWKYEGSSETPFKTNARGRAARLQNGNTLIAESLRGRALEVTPDGKIAWQIQLPINTEKPIGKQTKYWIITAKRYTAQELPFIRQQ